MLRIQCPHCKEYFDNDHWCQRRDELITYDKLCGTPPQELNPKPCLSIDPADLKKELVNKIHDRGPDTVKELGAKVPGLVDLPVGVIPSPVSVPTIDPHVTYQPDEKAPENGPESVTMDIPDPTEPATESDADFIDNILVPNTPKE